MKSWRRPWQAAGDKSNEGHPTGASRFNRVIPSPATPFTGHRTPLHDRRFATPYGLRYTTVSPHSTGPQQAPRNYMARFVPIGAKGVSWIVGPSCGVTYQASIRWTSLGSEGGSMGLAMTPTPPRKMRA